MVLVLRGDLKTAAGQFVVPNGIVLKLRFGSGDSAFGELWHDPSTRLAPDSGRPQTQNRDGLTRTENSPRKRLCLRRRG
jgi:hypothetical protein